MNDSIEHLPNKTDNNFSKYGEVLKKALLNGYLFINVCDFDKELLSSNKKIAIIKHDVDTNITLAKNMFAIEKALGVKSSYYFRLSTFNKEFVSELISYGCEVGYHFEEMSVYAYHHNLSNVEKIRNCYPIIRKNFINNKTNIENKFGLEIKTVAAHCDFVNNLINLSNADLLDKETRAIAKIKFEANDELLLSNAKYCSDSDIDFSEKLTFDDNSFYYLSLYPNKWNCEGFVRNVQKTNSLKKSKYKLFSKVVKVTDIIKQIKSLPKVKLTFTGDNNYNYYKYFTKPHHKYFFIKNKTLGACLLKKPESFEQYLTGKDKQILRTKRNKSIKNNYTFGPLNVTDYLEDIIEVNSSKEERQGREMNPDYFDKSKIISAAEDKDCFGVWDSLGKLVSYCYLIYAGDFVIISRLLGHANYLNDGVMHYMISECINMWINNKAWTNADYFLYDTWFGAKKGLRIFKTDLGFKPYRAKYKFK